MAARTEAYVDTSAFIALADRSDTYHPLFRRLFATPPSLVTTPLVVAEGHGWFLRRFDPSRALQFIAMVESMMPLEVQSVGDEDLRAATVILRRYADQPLTLADALGLHTMTERAIRSCWSTDRHLGLTGVPLAIHQT